MVQRQRVEASADVIFQLPPNDVFIAREGVDRFLKPRQIKARLMEGERPFQG